VLLADIADTEAALDIVDRFGTVSGLKLNRKKTVGIPLGIEEHGPGPPSNNLKWTKGPVRVLGIYVGGDEEERSKLNWDNKLHKLEKTLNLWKQRELTVFGKITIIKTLALPSIIYSASITSVPSEVTKQVEKLLCNFLWKTKDRIKRNRIINSVEKGGLNMIDIASQVESLKAVWINRILQAEKDHKWASLPRLYLHQIGMDIITSLNFTTEVFTELDKLPKFYREAIAAFSKAKEPNCVKTIEDLLQQPIWGNHILTVTQGRTKQVLYFKSWIQSGIRRLSDCRFEGGILSCQDMYTKVTNKRNILTECAVLQKALRPFKHMLLQNRNADSQTKHEVDTKNTKMPCKSKTFYRALVARKAEKAVISSKWTQGICPLSEDLLNKVFTDKVKLIKETKIAEFNYKLLYNILPCPSNLKKWKKLDNDMCDVCEIQCDMYHLILTCTLAKYTWKVIGPAFIKPLTPANIIYGVDFNVYENYAVSFAAFVLYKYWLFCHAKGKNRSLQTYKLFLRNELRFKLDIYAYMKNVCISDKLSSMISLIEAN